MISRWPLARMYTTGFFCLICIGCLEDSFDNDSLTQAIPDLNSSRTDNSEDFNIHRELSLKEVFESAREENRVDFVSDRNPFQFDLQKNDRTDSGEEIPEITVFPVEQVNIGDSSRDRSSTLVDNLKLIGLVDVESDGVTIAVFSDGSRVWQGRLNEVIAGEYLIKGISMSSVQIEVLSDGQTKRLTLEGI